MPTWDPLDSLHEAEGVGAPVAAIAKDKTDFSKDIYDVHPHHNYIPDIPELKNFPAEEVDALMFSVNAYIQSGVPWKAVSDVTARLGWYTPTCTEDNWQHKDVKLSLSQGIAYITLNRPTENNTLNDTIMHGLTDAIFVLHRRQDIRVVVFMSEGKTFSAGFDANALKHRRDGIAAPADAGDGSLARNPVKKIEQSPSAKSVLEQLGQEALATGAFPDGNINHEQIHDSMLWQTMTRLPQMTIALVDGSVIGMGLALPVCVDMTIATKGSYFCLEDLAFGLVPAILIPHLSQKLGPSNARFLLLTAANISASRAKELRLVQEVVEDLKAGHAFISKLCESLTLCGPRSVAKCKELVNGVAGNPITEKVMYFTANKLAQVTVSEEAGVAMVCLQEKRKKPWEDKPIQPLF